MNLLSSKKPWWVNLSLLMLTSTMIACGGGGEDVSSEGPATQPEPTPELPIDASPEPMPEQQAGSLGELQVADDFNFVNQYDYHISVSHPFDNAERVYANICTQWKAAQAMSVAYDSCIWRGGISQSTDSVSVTVPAHAHMLIIELWALSEEGITQRYQALDLSEFSLNTAHFEF